MSNFGIFLKCPLSKYGHVTWPKMQIWKNFYIFLILHLILGKAAKFLVDKLSTSEVINQKPHAPPQCFRVKSVVIGAALNGMKKNQLS